MNVSTLFCSTALCGMLALSFPLLEQDDPASGEQDLARRVQELEARVKRLESGGVTVPAGDAKERWLDARRALEEAEEHVARFQRSARIVDLDLETDALLASRFELEQRALDAELEEARIRVDLSQLRAKLEELPKTVEAVELAQTDNKKWLQLSETIEEGERELARLNIQDPKDEAVVERIETLRQEIGFAQLALRQLPRYIEYREVGKEPNPEHRATAARIRGFEKELRGSETLREQVAELRARQIARLEELQEKATRLKRLERDVSDAERRYDHAFERFLRVE